MQLPQPFFRKYDGWWYVQIRQDGKRRQIKLAQGRENRKLALERYWALMSQEDIALAADHTRLNVASLFDAFLDWSEKHNDRKTYCWYKRFLQDFCNFHRSPEVTALRPFHLTRWISLTPTMIDVTRNLIEKHPEGPLFRSDDGKTWNNNSVRLRMSRLRKRLNLPAGIVAYAYRHSFATNGLVNGVPIATMAELLGHTDTKMISAHYAHLGIHVDYLQNAAVMASITSDRPLLPVREASSS